MFDIKDPVCPFCKKLCDKKINSFLCGIRPSEDHFFDILIEDDKIKRVWFRLDNLCAVSYYNSTMYNSDFYKIESVFWVRNNLSYGNSYHSDEHHLIKISPPIVFDFSDVQKLKNKLKTILTFS